MLRFTCLPKQIAHWLQVLRPMLRPRPHRVFCWFLVCQAVSQEKATIKGWARLAPRHLAEWHRRRLRTAADWTGRVLLGWCAAHVMSVLPPPDDGLWYRVVDSPLKDNTGQKPPVAKTGRLNDLAPDVVGRHVVGGTLPWRNDRIPVACERVRRQDAPPDRSETRLCRWRLVRCRRPGWAETSVVVAEAALASTANVQLSQPRGSCFVMALARPWCFDKGHTLRALVPHLPKPHDRRCWVPLDDAGRRRTSWALTKRAHLRHGGEVPIIVSQKRRHDGPKPTTIVVTHLPDVRARQVVAMSRRRWSVARLMKALQGATGVGQPQVTQEPQRGERAIAMAVMASLRLVKLRAQDIPERGAWSILTLKRNFTWQLAQAPLEHSVRPRLSNGLQERKAA